MIHGTGEIIGIEQRPVCDDGCTEWVCGDGTVFPSLSDAVDHTRKIYEGVK